MDSDFYGSINRWVDNKKNVYFVFFEKTFIYFLHLKTLAQNCVVYLHPRSLYIFMNLCAKPTCIRKCIFIKGCVKCFIYSVESIHGMKCYFKISRIYMWAVKLIIKFIFMSRKVKGRVTLYSQNVNPWKCRKSPTKSWNNIKRIQKTKDFFS